MSNVDVVRYIYEKFKQGDAASVLAVFEPQIEFRLAEGHPYQPEGKPWFGGEEVTKHFFRKAGTEWENWNIIVDNILEAGDAVIVEMPIFGSS